MPTGLLAGPGAAWRRAAERGTYEKGTPMDLTYYTDRPDEPLSFDAVEAIGLDGTGRDGNERFPYTWGNLTDAERAALTAVAGQVPA